MVSANENGYSLLELIVAFAIATSALTAVFGVASRSSAVTRQAKDLTVASLLAASLYAEAETPSLVRVAARRGIHGERYRWQVTTRDHASKGLSLREVVVEVSWPGVRGDATYRLAGLKPDATNREPR